MSHFDSRSDFKQVFCFLYGRRRVTVTREDSTGVVSSGMIGAYKLVDQNTDDLLMQISHKSYVNRFVDEYFLTFWKRGFILLN